MRSTCARVVAAPKGCTEECRELLGSAVLCVATKMPPNRLDLAMREAKKKVQTTTMMEEKEDKWPRGKGKGKRRREKGGTLRRRRQMMGAGSKRRGF
ncbi:hypothetical protein CJ030_MR6G010781 [Morella rubra]|uniref:Uncharacterized protein n=1 Tax=Morella rubra TaxID=262757 RepID=A0A6A1VD69_9ROSI|nr:hypothetical protein CJ030_MR6G010781 [Morella rubra]